MMRFRNRATAALPLLGIALLVGPGAKASLGRQEPPPDNTKTNKQNTPTADQQGMNPADRELTKKIRSAIYKDRSLSTYAHNIKIISKDGRVTLKGPVRSEEEKGAIATKAAEIAGAGNVDNELEVAPK